MAGKQQKFRYEVDKKAGRPDVDGMRLGFLLTQRVAALAKNDNAAVLAAMKILEDAENNGFPLAVARRFVAGGLGKRPLGSPASVEGTGDIFLADATPSEAKVGWHRPYYDRLPEASALMEAEAVGRIFESGVYAHASARHVSALGGEWKSLAGHCGLGDGAYGSVVFVIRSDGDERWRSQPCKPGDLLPYEVDLQGTMELELVVEDAGDGTGSDWWLWLSPKLGR